MRLSVVRTRTTGILAFAAMYACAYSTHAAQLGIQGVTDPNVPVGYNAHEILWDGLGVSDWTSSVLRIDLSAGSFYQDPFGSDSAPAQVFINLIPSLAFDTYVGIIGDPTGGIAGGAGDVGGGPLSLDAPQLSVTWFNTDHQNTGQNRVGMLTLSQDAVGTGSLLYADPVAGSTQQDFVISNGVIPDFMNDVGSSEPPPPPPPPPPPTSNIPAELIPPANSPSGISLRTVFTSDVPQGFVANQLVWNGDGTQDWTVAAMTLDLTSGSVFQHPFGGDSAPSTAFFGLFPELAFDTHVGIYDDATGGIAGGAGDLGGGPLSLDAPNLSVSWFNTDTGDTGPVGIGLLTLSQDAQGTLTVLDQNGLTWSVPITNGVDIPEPATCLLLSVTAGLISARRR